ncbi:glycine N-methyltransferase [Culicoides brevitarsis]|uniref:glycine N-methyltransferase n=1 Tax=Culicoides brevitarsis TaxID=469753 RepID=UPI00307BAC8F
MPVDEQNIFSLRSNGVSAVGIRDQYADGKAARVWELFIGDQQSRTKTYRKFLTDLLRKNNCKRILDVACGTGVDSVLLLEEGFEVVSIDASDKMLKHALNKRWMNRKDPKFDKWVIQEANWLTLYEDIQTIIEKEGHFDAVMCLGNSFAHMMDNYGDQREQKHAIANFEKCLKPGGLLLIDHRNYDYILDTGSTPTNCIYYNSNHKIDIKTSVLYVAGKPDTVTLDYVIDLENGDVSDFRLSYYPHRLEVFRNILKEIFGHAAKSNIYGDFQPLDEIVDPAFYIHVIEKLH